MGGAVNYAGWEDVEINVGYGSGGFYINNTDGSGVRGLKWNPGWPYQGPDEGNEFVGWLGKFFSLSLIGEDGRFLMLVCFVEDEVWVNDADST